MEETCVLLINMPDLFLLFKVILNCFKKSYADANYFLVPHNRLTSLTRVLYI